MTKKIRLNRKIQKETLNKVLAELYAAINKIQEKQTKTIQQRQQEQLRAIENQTYQIKGELKGKYQNKEEDELPQMESNQQEDEFHDPGIQSIDRDFSITINGLFNPNITSTKFKFTSSDINNYKVNDKPFRIVDDKIKFNDRVFQISPSFLNPFMKLCYFLCYFRSNNDHYKHFTRDEKFALLLFIDYIGGQKGDKKSNL